MKKEDFYGKPLLPPLLHLLSIRAAYFFLSRRRKKKKNSRRSRACDINLIIKTHSLTLRFQNQKNVKNVPLENFIRGSLRMKRLLLRGNGSWNSLKAFVPLPLKPVVIPSLLLPPPPHSPYRFLLSLRLSEEKTFFRNFRFITWKDNFLMFGI